MTNTFVPISLFFVCENFSFLLLTLRGVFLVAGGGTDVCTCLIKQSNKISSSILPFKTFI